MSHQESLRKMRDMKSNTPFTQYTWENERKGMKPGGNKSIFKEGQKEGKIRRKSKNAGVNSLV